MPYSERPMVREEQAKSRAYPCPCGNEVDGSSVRPGKSVRCGVCGRWHRVYEPPPPPGAARTEFLKPRELEWLSHVAAVLACISVLPGIGVGAMPAGLGRLLGP